MLSSNHCIASNTSQEYLYWKPPQENPLMGSLLYSRLQVSKVENSKYIQLKGMHVNNAIHSKPEKSCSNLLLVMILYFFYRHTQLRQSTRIEPMIHPLFWREKLTVLRFLWVTELSFSPSIIRGGSYLKNHCPLVITTFSI